MAIDFKHQDEEEVQLLLVLIPW